MKFATMRKAKEIKNEISILRVGTFAGKLGLFLLAAFLWIGADSPKNDDTQKKVLFVSYSKYNFYAPKATLKREKQSAEFEAEKMCASYFDQFVDVLEEEKKCDVQFEILNWEDSKQFNSIMRLEQENKKAPLRVNLDTALSPELKEELLATEANFYCFVTKYEIDADLEDKFPEHSIHYDLLDQSLNRVGNERVSGKVFQSRVIDPSKKLQLVLNDLASNVCKTISDYLD